MPRSVGLAVLLVLAFIVVQTVAFGVLVAAGIEIDVTERFDGRDALALAAVQLAGIAVGAALVHGRALATSWQSVGLGGAGSGWRGAWALAPVGLLVVGPSMGIVLADGDPLVHPSVGAGDAAAFVLLAGLIALNEELWFRGLLASVLGGAARPWLTIVTTSILFGLPHVGDGAASVLNAIGVTLAVGVPFAAVRVRHGSLWPLVGWHAVIDVWAFVQTASVVAEGSPTASEFVAALVLPAVVAACYLAWFARRRPAAVDVA